MKGDLDLPTIQQGKLVVVRIPEGSVYKLPSRVPHSPQRPHEGSFGLVIERERYDCAGLSAGVRSSHFDTRHNV